MRDGAIRGPGTRYARRAARVAAGVAVAVALTLVAACGDAAENPGTPSATTGLPTSLPTGIPTSLPSGIPTALPTDIPLPGGPANVPEGFPIPPGAEKEVTDVGGGQTLRLTGVSAADAFAFYRKALPDAGYKIDSDTAGSGPIPGLISFTGHDVSGELSGVDVAGQSTVLVAFLSSS